jgi:hypothetical protein
LLKDLGLDASKLPHLFVTDFDWRSLLWAPPYANIAHTHALPFPREPGLTGVEDMVRLYAGKPVVILIRDFRDLIVSSFMHEVFRSPKARFVGTIDDFADSEIFGVERIIRYYELIWRIRAAQTGPTKVLTYEQLWNDTHGALSDVLKFLGLNHDKEIVHFAVPQASLENMRQMEMESTQDTMKIPGLFRSVNEGKNAMKVRRGGVGNWKNQLSDEKARQLALAYEKCINFLQHNCFVAASRDMDPSRSRNRKTGEKAAMQGSAGRAARRARNSSRNR